MMKRMQEQKRKNDDENAGTKGKMMTRMQEQKRTNDDENGGTEGLCRERKKLNKSKAEMTSLKILNTQYDFFKFTENNSR